MDKEENVSLTPGQFIFLIVGILVGVYIFRFPNIVVKKAHQDAWMAVIISAVYPLYILLISNYIIKRHPSENLLDLSKKYMGKAFGNILNFIFSSCFFIFVPVITANLVSLIYVYGQSYIEPYKITIVIILITAYAAYHDLKVQGKISEIMFIPTFLLVIFTFYGFKKGSILNLMPVFQTDFKDILSASRETLYAYVTIEILLLIHPFFKDTKSIKKLSFIALGLVVFIYFWVVFISIYFLGIDLVAINIWPFVMVSESINLPITSNFRTFFIVAWNLIQFKLISSVYFFSAFTFSSIIGLKRKRVVLYYLPIYIGLSMLFINQEARNIIFNYYVPSIIIFNILFITAIGIFTAVRSNKKNANTGNTKENK